MRNPKVPARRPLACSLKMQGGDGNMGGVRLNTLAALMRHREAPGPHLGMDDHIPMADGNHFCAGVAAAGLMGKTLEAGHEVGLGFIAGGEVQIDVPVYGRHFGRGPALVGGVDFVQQGRLSQGQAQHLADMQGRLTGPQHGAMVNGGDGLGAKMLSPGLGLADAFFAEAEAWQAGIKYIVGVMHFPMADKVDGGGHR